MYEDEDDEDLPAYLQASMNVAPQPTGALSGSPGIRDRMFQQGFGLMQQADRMGLSPDNSAMEQYISALDKPRSKWEEATPLLMTGLGMMEAAGKPGATLFGSVGTGGKQGLSAYTEQQAAQRDRDAKLAAMRYQLAQSGQDRALRLLTAGGNLVRQAGSMKDSDLIPMPRGGLYDRRTGKVISGDSGVPSKMNPGQGYKDPETGKWVVPVPKDSGTEHETWSNLTPEDAQRLGLPDTNIYQKSNRGSIRPIAGRPQPKIRFMTDEEKKAGGFKPDDVIQVEEVDGRLTGTKVLKKGDERLSPQVLKMIDETDEKITNISSAVPALEQAIVLNKTATDGPFALQRAKVSSQFGDRSAKDLLEMENKVMRQALGQLKAIFGGAPTEGERAALIELEAGLDRPRDVRQKALNDALLLAQKRLAAERKRAAALRAGTYGRAEGDPNREDALTPEQARRLLELEAKARGE